MDNEIKIEIAGFCICMEISDEAMLKNLREYYRDFLTSRKPGIIIHVEVGDFSFPKGKKVISSTENWTLAKTRNKYIIMMHDLPRDFHAWSIAKFDSKCKTVEFITQDSSGRHLAMPFLSIFFAILLSKGKGAIIHSCGMLYNSKGYLFIGPSGSGKSTLANLPGKHAVLNDEVIIIRKYGTRFRMFGNPWHGERGKGGQGSAVINKIFFIRLSLQGNIIQPLNKDSAYKKLIVNFFLPIKGIPELGHIFKLSRDLAAKAPSYNLGFFPDGKFWKYFSGYFSSNGFLPGMNQRLQWPLLLKGPLMVRPFGVEEFVKEDIKGFHRGIDILAPASTPVYAASSGKAQVQNKRCRTHAEKFIQINSSGNLKIIYRHLSEAAVKDNQIVSRGQLIGWTADIKAIWQRRLITPHLHLEIKRNGESQDPLRGYFPRNGNLRFIDNNAMVEDHKSE